MFDLGCPLHPSPSSKKAGRNMPKSSGKNLPRHALFTLVILGLLLSVVGISLLFFREFDWGVIVLTLGLILLLWVELDHGERSKT